MSTVTAIFKSRLDAETAISRLEATGVTPSQISMVMTDEVRGSHFKIEESDKSDEGAATGAGIGGLIGAVAGTVLSAGVIVIPGLNLVVAGTLVSALAGLGTGAIAGGVMGGQIGAGIPEHEAKYYEKEISSGSILVAVEAKDGDQKKSIQNVFQASDSSKAA